MNESPDQDIMRIKRYARVYLRDDATLPEKAQIPLLNKKLRNKWIQLALNAVIILFFTYIYFSDTTTLHSIFYYVVLGVFLINVALIYIQQRNIYELLSFYEEGGRLE